MAIEDVKMAGHLGGSCFAELLTMSNVIYLVRRLPPAKTKEHRQHNLQYYPTDLEGMGTSRDWEGIWGRLG